MDTEIIVEGPEAGWSDGRKARLRLLWCDAGRSASDIAGELGVSRNSVLGMVHRLGLQPRRSGARPKRPSGPPPPAVVFPSRARREPLASSGSPRPSPPASSPRKPDAPVAPAIDVAPAPPDGVGLLELTSCDCRWPISGQGLSTLFCGQPKRRGSYCALHGAIAAGERRVRVTTNKLGKLRTL